MKRLILTLALLASPAAAQDRITLILDWFVNPDHGPIIIAQQQGFFADEGLEVEIVAPADPSDPPKLVAAGRADLAVSYQPNLHLAVHEGLPLIRVGTLIATPLNCLIVQADGPVQSIADLKGREIGYSIPGFETTLLGAMLAKHDLTTDDIQMVNVASAIRKFATEPPPPSDVGQQGLLRFLRRCGSAQRSRCHQSRYAIP